MITILARCGSSRGRAIALLRSAQWVRARTIALATTNGPGAVPSTAMRLEELREAVEEGTIDTVLRAVTDMQGRLAGKRLVARFFLEEVAAHGAEGCNYLLAVDVDMNTVDGYAMASWERGYGDFVMRPDLSTLCLVPWLPGTALCLADLEWA